MRPAARLLPRPPVAAEFEGQHATEIWVAYDRQMKIQAAWWHGCAQPHRSWRKVCKHLGWRTTLLRAYSLAFMPVEW